MLGAFLPSLRLSTSGRSEAVARPSVESELFFLGFVLRSPCTGGKERGGDSKFESPPLLVHTEL